MNSPSPVSPASRAEPGSPTEAQTPNAVWLTFQHLRLAVGLIAWLLPPLVVLIAAVADAWCLPSLSDSYFSHARNLFVGLLFALAMFFGCYQGPRAEDSRLSLLCAACALGVALCPARGETEALQWWHVAHYLSAGLLFTALAVFCQRFRRTDPARTPTAQKQWRNRIYRSCQYTIVAALLLIGCGAAARSFLHWPVPEQWVLAMEWLMVWAFGLAWLTKSELLNQGPLGWLLRPDSWDGV